MTPRPIAASYRTAPGSLLRQTLGEDLDTIRQEDGATWADIGQVLGKSKWSAAGYAAGEGDMGVISFLRGCERWDGRFAGRVMGLVGMRIAPIATIASAAAGNAMRALAELMAAKAAALEDGVVTDEELEEMWAKVEAVACHIDRLRARRAAALRRLPAHDTS